MVRDENVQRPKRILVIADPESPLSRERGLVGLKGGYEIFWYSLTKAELEGVVSALTPPLRHPHWVSALSSPWFLRDVIHRVRPGLIHVHFAYQGVDNLIISQFRPIILTVMGGDILQEQRFHGVRTWLIKKILDAAEVITSKSSFMDEALNQIGDYSQKIRRVTWGVDTQKFRPGLDSRFLRERLNIQPEDLVIICPRICQPFYNKHLVIQAFASFVRQSEPRFKAKLIISELFADEAYGQYLRTLVAKCGLKEQVRFVGTIPHEEMPAYFNLADIMVATPPSDGMPQSLYEAMACGSYPILGDLRQYKELLQDGVNGRLVPVGDVRALAEVIIQSVLDPQQRKWAAVINRQRVMEMADKDVQERLVNTLYDEVWQKYKRISARS